MRKKNMLKDPYMDTLVNFTPNAGISKKKKHENRFF